MHTHTHTHTGKHHRIFENISYLHKNETKINQKRKLGKAVMIQRAEENINTTKITYSHKK